MIHFKPGERVRLRGDTCRGTVNHVTSSDGFVAIQWQTHVSVHNPELLIRLKPKRKPRQWVLTCHMMQPGNFHQVNGPALSVGESILVREIITKEKVK